MAITITRPAKPTVTVVRRFDAVERLVHETVDGTTTSYAYDKSSNVTDVFLTTPAMSRAQVLHYEWDARNRVTLIKDVRANREVGLVYDPASQLTKLTYPSGVTKDMTYGLRGETKSITYKTPAGSNIRTLEYEYDDGLQLIERRETASVGASEKTTYGYDKRGQLKSASYPDGTGELFEYDSSGNMVQYVVLGAPGGTTSELRVHDAADQLNIIAGSRQITFTYDPRGNLRTRTENGVTTTYTWDSAGRLLGVTGGATLTAEYADDYRLIKVQEGDQAAFTPVWCLDNILVELTPTGAEQNFTLSMLDLDSPLERALPDGTYETLLTDHLMSAIAAVDQTGTEVRATKYGAYGNVRSGASPGPVGYAGARSFDGGRLLFLRNRFYSPELGRFISRDPVGFAGGLNLYSYIGNDPLALRDPFGLEGPQGWGSKLADFVDRQLPVTFDPGQMLARSAILGTLRSGEGLGNGPVIANYALVDPNPGRSSIDRNLSYTLGYTEAGMDAFGLLSTAFGAVSLARSLAGSSISRLFGCPPRESPGLDMIGRPRGATPRTLEDRLDPIGWLNKVADKYGINLRKVQIRYDPDMPFAKPGTTPEAGKGTYIRLGPGALVDERTAANTIAHELSHARDYVRINKGLGTHKPHGDTSSINPSGRGPGERSAYGAGNALEDWILGNR